jgi:hypothetical protein
MVDFLDELLEDESNEGDGTDSLPTREDLASLKAEIEALNKEKAGLLKGVKEERSRRQEISGRLNQLTDTVQGILSQKQQQQAAFDSIGNNPEAGKLPVTWTEDGDGYVSVDKIDELLNPYKEEIQNLREQMNYSTSQSQAEREAERVKEAIVGEDERYDPAYRKYQAARKWVTDVVSDFVQTNGISRPLTSAEALDHVFDTEDAQEAFSTRFPGMNIDDVVLAEDSKRLFRNMLRNVSSGLEANDPKPTPDERFQKVLKKPASLAGQPNAKGGSLSIADKVQSLTAADFEGMSDAQVEALMKAIESEERNEGVVF